ncbi:MAG: PadR family transcriptional regulator [Verrucomicrobia bacterium]|nr:PadR family transcriptional regulator [Verrucomicrobiota bacterium]
MSGCKTKSFDFEECACSGRTLGKLVRPYILALLADGPAHGYALLEQLSEAGIEPDHSVVYRALNSMEKEGLVSSRRTAGTGGPTRWEYELTPTGHACLRRWQRSLTRYRAAIDSLLKLIRS